MVQVAFIDSKTISICYMQKTTGKKDFQKWHNLEFIEICKVVNKANWPKTDDFWGEFQRYILGHLVRQNGQSYSNCQEVNDFRH